MTRVALEVGSEGKLGGQAVVRGVAGVWKDLTDSVNSMAGNLTAQVRNIAEVTTAVANGDLRKKVTVDVKGEISQLKNTINAMIDQLNSFASEVTRVAREVGTEGRLGGQAQIQGVAGVWKDLTDSVNSMAGNLTGQVRNIAEVTTAVANGDLTKKVTVDVRGEILELKNTINAMVDQLNSFASEVTRVAREVGSEGRLGGQAQVRGVAGVWKDLTDNVNSMAGNLTDQVRNIAEVTTSVANGDLSKKITVDVKGEILQLKNTINAMVDQLNSFASEVTRVAREVGTEGQLGGQAQVRGVAGVWKDLTDSVNSMAGNLTSQVRGIAKVVTAVANGDLKRKLVVEAKGEIAALSDTINEMTDTLATFAEQVTTVAREVGVEGQLGGQAKVPGAAGTWKGLTENVNQLAANLTTQVRAIAEVATAVTKGDLTRSITVEAQGEVAALKDNINEMIRNLKDTTQKNTEQDWLKTNLAKFTRMLQGQRDLLTVTKLILNELAPVVSAQHGVFYMMDQSDGDAMLKLTSTYAYRERKGLRNEFHVGEGLVGQCAYEKERILITDVPGDYVRISSGLGEAPPLNIVVLPVIFEGQVMAVIELASFHRFNEIHVSLLDQLTETIAIVLNTISANMRTEDLLAQSQSLATELQDQQEELRETNTRLERQAASLQESEELLRRQQDELEEGQRGARDQGEPAHHAEDAGRGQEPRDRAGQAGARGEGRAARDDLEVQERVPGQHVARAAHAAQQPPDPGRDARRQHRREPVRQAARVRADDLRGGVRPAVVDQRHPRHGQDRVGDDGDRGRRPPLRRPPRLRRADLPPGGADQGPRPGRRPLRWPAEGRLDRRQEAPAGAPQPPVERLQVHRAGRGPPRGRPGDRGLGHRPPVAQPGGPRRGVRRHRHRHRHPVGQAAGHLRAVPAGRHGDQPQVRRHGAGPVDQPRDRPAAGGRDPRPEHGRRGEHLHPLPAAGRRAARPRPAPAIAPAPERAPLDARRAPADGGTAGRDLVTATSTAPRAEPGGDPIGSIQPGERVLLIVEHEPRFASILVDKAHEMGFKAVIASEGQAALELVREIRPAAITLDLRLPDMEGWIVLDRLKHDPATRHVPVHVISVDDSWHRGLRLGAFAFLKKPVSKKSLDDAFASLKGFVERDSRTLLVVEDNQVERDHIVAALGGDQVRTTAVGTGAEALAALRGQAFDCMVLDLNLPDGNGIDLLESIKREIGPPNLRVVVYTGRDLTEGERARLEEMAEATIVKDVRSLEHLVERATLFLHRVEVGRAPGAGPSSRPDPRYDPSLAGKTILVVDDDVRNVFALASKLERWGMRVVRAENGKQAIQTLQGASAIDLVLMDIMMPEMDGYETIRAIRAQDRLRSLPIIALTAKAMKDDRRKCLEAGASDYLAKPVAGEHLLSTLRVWLQRQADRPQDPDGQSSPSAA